MVAKSLMMGTETKWMARPAAMLIVHHCLAQAEMGQIAAKTMVEKVSMRKAQASLDRMTAEDHHLETKTDMMLVVMSRKRPSRMKSAPHLLVHRRRKTDMILVEMRRKMPFRMKVAPLLLVRTGGRKRIVMLFETMAIAVARLVVGVAVVMVAIGMEETELQVAGVGA
jgi:hypothetical protein